MYTNKFRNRIDSIFLAMIKKIKVRFKVLAHFK